MKKIIAGGLLALMTFPSLSDEYIAIGTGTYQLSEFDSQKSGLYMAEKEAFNDIAEQVKAKSLSIQKIDKNGYYKRASWLISSAVITSKEVNHSIEKCKDKDALCATVTINATVDDEQAEQQLNKLYSNKLLSEKLDQLIQKESVREKLILEGESVSNADTVQRQEQRKELLGVLAQVKNEATLNLNLETINKSRQDWDLIKEKKLSNESLVLDYRTILSSIKSDLMVTPISQNIYTRNDGSGSLNVELNIKSDKLKKLVDWIAVNIGDKNNNWSKYKLSPTPLYKNSWRYQLNSFAESNKKLVESIQVGLLDGETAGNNFYNSNLDFYAIQYGMYKERGYNKYDKYPNNHLNLDKLELMSELTEYSLCIELKMESNGKNSMKCIIGGEKSSDGNSYSNGWDLTVPFIWVGKSNSSVWLSIDLDKSELSRIDSNVKLKHTVKIEK